MGDEFLVSQTPAGRPQSRPDVDQNAAGAFVVVWVDEQDAQRIQGHLYDSGGVTVGDQFVVASTNTYSMTDPAVAIDPSGSFTVVWGAGSDGMRRVWGRAFDSTGTAVGGEFAVSSSGYGRTEVDVAPFDANNSLVVWNDGCGECSDDVVGRVVSDTGAGLGVEFDINTTQLGYIGSLALDGEPGRDFVVVWGDRYFGEGNLYRVEAQRLMSDGSPIGTEFTVNSTAQSSSVNERLGVAVQSDGDFIVAWAGEEPSVSDEFGVLARLFTSDGSAVGDEFQVNTYSTGRQGYSSGVKVAYDADTSEFVVVWASYGQDGDSYGVFGQRLSTSGSMLGAEIQVNTYTTYAQGGDSAVGAGFSIASGGNGEFVVVWDSAYQVGAYRDIFGQRFSTE